MTSLQYRPKIFSYSFIIRFIHWTLPNLLIHHTDNQSLQHRSKLDLFDHHLLTLSQESVANMASSKKITYLKVLAAGWKALLEGDLSKWSGLAPAQIQKYTPTDLCFVLVTSLPIWQVWLDALFHLHNSSLRGSVYIHRAAFFLFNIVFKTLKFFIKLANYF